MLLFSFLKITFVQHAKKASRSVTLGDQIKQLEGNYIDDDTDLMETSTAKSVPSHYYMTDSI